jgi:DNA polymerase-3 subunit epsilon
MGKPNIKDRIAEISVCVFPDGTEKIYLLANPTVPIPAETTAVHGNIDG